MIQKFATKMDVNGNRYTLIIDHARRVYIADYNPFSYDGYIIIGKRERRAMIDELQAARYKAQG